MSYSIAQQAQRQGRSHWSWSLELAGSPEELDRVDWVEYTLHPTFYPPVHRITDRASAFRLDGSGWGEFMVHVAIRRRDGETISLQHWLDLDSNERPGGYPASSSGMTRQASPAAPPAAGSPASPSPRGPEPTRPGSGAPQPRTVYLSSGLADRAAASVLREALTTAGVEVRTGNDLSSAADSIEAMIHSQIEAADGAIFLLSGRESPWALHELSTARELSLPLSVVRIGEPRGESPGPGAGASLDIRMPPTDAAAADVRPLVEWASTLPVRTKRPGSRS